MPLEFYKFLHIISAILVLMALGSAAANSAVKAAGQKLYGMLHGIGILIMLVAGFGALAKLGMNFSGWVITKIVLWVVLGGMLTLIKKMPDKAMLLWYASFAVAAIAALMAIYKPF